MSLPPNNTGWAQRPIPHREEAEPLNDTERVLRPALRREGAEPLKRALELIQKLEGAEFFDDETINTYILDEIALRAASVHESIHPWSLTTDIYQIPLTDEEKKRFEPEPLPESVKNKFLQDAKTYIPSVFIDDSQDTNDEDEIP